MEDGFGARPSEDELLLGENIPTGISSPHTQLESLEVEELIWTSWYRLLSICFIIAGQVFAIISTSGLTSLIARDFGSKDGLITVDWVFQVPLLMQGLLSPLVARISSILGTTCMAIALALVSTMGALLSTKATSLKMLVFGQLMTGLGLSSMPLLYKIASTVTPGQYQRSFSNRAAFLGVAIGTVIGSFASLMAYYGGWRLIFQLQAISFVVAALCLWILHGAKANSVNNIPATNVSTPRDLIESGLLFLGGLMLFFALNQYCEEAIGRDDSIRLTSTALLCMSCVLLVAYCLYEIVYPREIHVPRSSKADACKLMVAGFSLAVEGSLFFGVMSRMVPSTTYHLGFRTTAEAVPIHHLSFTFPLFAASVFQFLLGSSLKGKLRLLASYVVLMLVTIACTGITSHMSHIQIGMNILAGLALTTPLTTILQVMKPVSDTDNFTAFCLAARSLGGVFGSIVLTTTIKLSLEPNWASAIDKAAVQGSLLSSSVPDLLSAMKANTGFWAVEGMNDEILMVAMDAGRNAYANAYSKAWVVMLPLVAMSFLGILLSAAERDNDVIDSKDKGKNS